MSQRPTQELTLREKLELVWNKYEIAEPCRVARWKILPSGLIYKRNVGGRVGKRP